MSHSWTTATRGSARAVAPDRQSSRQLDSPSAPRLRWIRSTAAWKSSQPAPHTERCARPGVPGPPSPPRSPSPSAGRSAPTARPPARSLAATAGSTLGRATVVGGVGGQVHDVSAPLGRPLKAHRPDRLGPAADDRKAPGERLELAGVEAVVRRYEHSGRMLVAGQLAERFVEQLLGLRRARARTARSDGAARRKRVRWSRPCRPKADAFTRTGAAASPPRHRSSGRESLAVGDSGARLTRGSTAIR